MESDADTVAKRKRAEDDAEEKAEEAIKAEPKVEEVEEDDEEDDTDKMTKKSKKEPELCPAAGPGSCVIHDITPTNQTEGRKACRHHVSVPPGMDVEVIKVLQCVCEGVVREQERKGERACARARASKSERVFVVRSV